MVLAFSNQPATFGYYLSTWMEVTLQDAQQSSMAALGEVLRSVRKERGLSRASLEVLSGVHRNTILRIEQDASSLTMFRLECLCAAMRVSVTEVCSRAGFAP